MPQWRINKDSSKKQKTKKGRTRIFRAKQTSDSDSVTSKTLEKHHLKFFPQEMGILGNFNFLNFTLYMYFGVSHETKGVSGYKKYAPYI
jgi:hypothetical protein